MDNLFNDYDSYDKYKNVLSEPFNADDTMIIDQNYSHTQKIYLIDDNKITPIDKLISIKNIIDCLFFLYTDFGEFDWDDRYWFFVGKLYNGFYFMYETKCNGTGFGLGTEATIYFSKIPQYLIKYGFTDKHRELIVNNIHKRFICP